MSERETEERRVIFAIEQEHRVLYTAYLGATLGERCKQLAEQRSPLSLEPEIELARALVPDTLAAYDAAVAAAPGKPLVAVAAGNMIFSAVHQVSVLMQAHKKIISEAQLDAFQVQAVLLRVAQIIDQKFQRIAPVLKGAGIDPTEFTREIASEFDQIQLPYIIDEVGSGANGKDMTELEPADDEAMAMDDTVPAYRNGVA